MKHERIGAWSNKYEAWSMKVRNNKREKAWRKQKKVNVNVSQNTDINININENENNDDEKTGFELFFPRCMRMCMCIRVCLYVYVCIYEYKDDEYAKSGDLYAFSLFGDNKKYQCSC